MFDLKPLPDYGCVIVPCTDAELMEALDENSRRSKEMLIQAFGGDKNATDQFVRQGIDGYRTRVGLPPLP